jgi:ATP-dependent helicase/nuclease subunit B
MDEMDALVNEAMDSYAKQYGDTILYSDARNEYRIKQMERMIKRSIQTIRYQLGKGNFKPALFEESFTMKGDFPLIGKIDRVDFAEEDDKVYVKVIDYKTGGKRFDLNEFYYGLSLQLPVYMNAALALAKEKFAGKEVLPAAMLLYQLQNPFLNDRDWPDMNPGQTEEIERKLCKKMRPNGLVVEDESIVRMFDKDFSSDSDVICVAKKKDGSFKAESQTLPQQDFSSVLSDAEEMTQKLMQDIMRGNISVNPVQLEGAKNDSCSFCAYRSVCGMDTKIPGYKIEELPKIAEAMREEKMKDAVHSGSAERHFDEK